jgi:small GTP-binding protein
VVIRMEYKYILKILFFGDPSAGKRDFAKYYSQFYNEGNYLTIGVGFYPIIIQFKGKLVKLQIWDVREEERHRNFVHQYCRGANRALLIYDFAKSKTLDSVVKYIPLIRENDGDVPIVLIGNQVDIEANREISKEYGKALARKY